MTVASNDRHFETVIKKEEKRKKPTQGSFTTIQDRAFFFLGVIKSSATSALPSDKPLLCTYKTGNDLGYQPFKAAPAARLHARPAEPKAWFGSFTDVPASTFQEAIIPS